MTPITKPIPVDQIRPFIRRSRSKEGFDQLKASMKDVGLKIPIQVRDLGKRDKDGHRYELIVGEGRTEAARQLRWPTIPATVIDAPELEIAGRFLAENMIRKGQPWAEKGRTVKALMDTGLTVAQAAKRLHISENAARKYVRIIDKGIPEAQEMAVNDAEVLTTLPPAGQRIVMEFAAETGQTVQAMVKVAKKANLAKKGGGWTKAALHKALRADDDTLRKQRETLKRLRLHHALGYGNVATLLKSKPFLAAARTARLNLSAFAL